MFDPDSAGEVDKHTWCIVIDLDTLMLAFDTGKLAEMMRDLKAFFHKYIQVW